MIKYIVLSLLLFIPFVSKADDHCTNPNEYTIDKRCYVTDEQKKTTPYNASVALVNNPQNTYDEGLYCSGTIVKGADGHPYLYTAAHCTKGIGSQIHFKLPDGRYGSASIQTIGNKDEAKQDWAVGPVILDEHAAGLPMVELSNKKITEKGIEIGYNARSVGHGALKIMSDKKIADFKTKYKTFLEGQKKVNPTAQERVEDFDDRYKRGIYFDVDSAKKEDPLFYNFLLNNLYIISHMFDEGENLKVSNCKYTNHGRDIHCQAWSGDSGGGVFDKDGNLIAIHTRGIRYIGGQNHAGNWSKREADDIDNLPVKTVPTPEPEIKKNLITPVIFR